MTSEVREEMQKVTAELITLLEFYKEQLSGKAGYERYMRYIKETTHRLASVMGIAVEEEEGTDTLIMLLQKHQAHVDGVNLDAYHCHVRDIQTNIIHLRRAVMCMSIFA